MRYRRLDSKYSPGEEYNLPLVVIGLGNPGQLYDGTRHNIGFQVIHSLSDKLSIKLKKPFFSSYMRGKGSYQHNTIFLVKPLTYMNRSGMILSSVLRFAHAQLSEILVICDSLDLEPGVCRLKIKGSSAGHKGLASIIDYAGTDEIARLYIGIGRSRQPVIEYVLSKPSKEDALKLNPAINKATSAILLLLEKSPQEVMNVINRRTIGI